MRGSVSGMHDPYEDQFAAARYRVERDQAREELARIREDRSWDARADAGMLGAKEDSRAVEWVRDHGGLESVEARLMPEGMEWLIEAWPRFEDDSPLGRGDEVMTSDGAVKAEDLSLTICDKEGGVTSIDFGERVKRPDSLGRLAKDIVAMVVALRSNRSLFDAQEAAAGCVGENTMDAALDSLVRRVKALAERGQ